MQRENGPQAVSSISSRAESSKQRSRRATTGPTRRNAIGRRIIQDRWMYLLMLPGVIYFVVFHYIPMLGNVIAFKDYSPFLGIQASPWVGLENFRNLLTDPDLGIALRNTLVINLVITFFAFPASISLALLINSMLHEPVKRVFQSVLYLPHFLSWVIVIALWQQTVGGNGVVNQVLREQGWGAFNIMGNPSFFKFLAAFQYIWKEAGWESIVILAALSSIDVTLYEAAALDGANARQRLLAVTLPGIRGIVFLLLILWIGTALSTGFEQFYLQRNAVGPRAAEVLDTFTFFRGVRGGDWGLATAVGLIKGIIGAVLIFGANKLAKRFGEEGVF